MTAPPIAKPYLLFLGDVRDPTDAKTAFGLRDWARDDCLGQFRLGAARVDLGLPDMTPEAAARAGARSLVIGVAPVGGRLDPAWEAPLEAALRAGLDLVSGMHDRLGEHPRLSALAAGLGRTLHDVRVPRGPFPVATGRRRSGRRLLTVGTDCALGKKYTALTITRELLARGRDASFRATGQTGILISGAGIPIDAVVADFIAGAAETLSPDAAPDSWQIIEGQGSLFHPGYAAVTLGLLHGSQPDAMVLCHDPGRRQIEDCPGFALPSLEAAMDIYLRTAALTNPAARFVGLSLNTSAMEPAAALELIEATGKRHGLPCIDPLRTGAAAIADALEAAPWS